MLYLADGPTVGQVLWILLPAALGLLALGVAIITMTRKRNARNGGHRR